MRLPSKSIGRKMYYVNPDLLSMKHYQSSVSRPLRTNPLIRMKELVSDRIALLKY